MSAPVTVDPAPPAFVAAVAPEMASPTTGVSRPVTTPASSAPPPPVMSAPVMSAPVTVDPAPPAFVAAPASNPATATAPPLMGAVATATATATATKPDRATGMGPADAVPPRWWVKYVLWLGTAIIVVIIVAMVRSNSPSSNPGSPLSSPPVHVSKTVLTQYTAISATLDRANAAAAKALANGSSQTAAQVVAEVAPYLTALDAFDFNLHLISWPKAMQAPTYGLALELQALTQYLGSASSANASSLNSWVAQFHALAQKTQTADNVIRGDIGLPATTSYP
jgi:hypothetical protein